MVSDAVWMSAVARDRLADEVSELDRRVAAGDDVDAARLGLLRELLRNAEVDRKPDDGLVEPGMRVTIRFDADASMATFLFGERALADLDPGVDVEVYSPTSPLGAAINGRYAGDEVVYAAPSGPQRITIVQAVPFG